MYIEGMMFDNNQHRILNMLLHLNKLSNLEYPFYKDYNQWMKIYNTKNCKLRKL